MQFIHQIIKLRFLIFFILYSFDIFLSGIQSQPADRIASLFNNEPANKTALTSSDSRPSPSSTKSIHRRGGSSPQPAITYATNENVSYLKTMAKYMGATFCGNVERWNCKICRDPELGQGRTTDVRNFNNTITKMFA
jgi:hypothetical protein